MRLNKSYICLFLLCGVFLTSLVFAQLKSTKSGFEYGRERMLLDLDRDDNGLVTREEWSRFFANRDVNADGALSREELWPGEVENPLERDEKGREQVFQNLDRDKDGNVTRSEWRGKDTTFNRRDANRDGVISLEEFLSVKARYWNELFEELDSNGDGKITRSEWFDTEETFKKKDRDRNGVVDRVEFYTRG